MITWQKIRSKLNREARHLLRDAGHNLGFYRQFYRSARGSRIMIYHGICLKDPTRFNPIFLDLKRFKQHLRFYKKHFNVISLDDYYEQKFSRDKFNICLTFDDGFANNYKYVLPLLAQYQLPATFFVTAIRAAGYDILWNDFLGIVSRYGPQNIQFENERYQQGLHNKYFSTPDGVSLVERLRSSGFPQKAEMMRLLYPATPFRLNTADEDYWLQMTEEQLRELFRSPYATIGAHGHYHNDLARIDIKDAEAEISFSKLYLETITGKQVKSFAFPYGSYSPQVVNAAKLAGFKHLLAMDFLFPADQEDQTIRERFTVNPFISTNNQMYATVIRNYEC